MRAKPSTLRISHVVSPRRLGRFFPRCAKMPIFGQSVHVLVDERATPTDLGLRPEQVRETEPNLEDVFVTLSKAQKAA